MVATFNGVDDSGRQTAVIRDLHHAFEMLLKAALSEKSVKLFDRKSGRSLGFEKCVRLSREHLGLSGHQVGLLRAIDAVRDDEQHWLSELSEGLLYLHARAGVTLFDEILERTSRKRLGDYLPERVLPISTSPITEVEILVDQQYKQVKDLLRPGKRRRVEARSMLRGLLAMEGHVSDDARVSERDVDRVERAVREGKPVEQVFPRLTNVAATYSGEGSAVQVQFTKRQGAPVQLVPADDPRETAAVREVDLQRKYHLSKSDLAEKVGLTRPKANALRQHLGIDEDEDYAHVFQFESQKHFRYSDNAVSEDVRGARTR